MALSLLGNYGTVMDIDTPTDDKERTFALWLPICRQFTLKMLMPNFSLSRRIVGKLSEEPAFGYSYFYEYPNEALKILGVGDAKDRQDDYNIELTPNGIKAIGHGYDYTEGMPVRFIIDVEDMTLWTVEAVILLSEYLAAYTCVQITQDVQKGELLKRSLPAQISSASGLNAQENRPVRISNSRFRQARYINNPQNTDKK